MAEEASLIRRLMDYFGMGASEIRVEYPQLTDTDKQWFVEQFNAMGLPTVVKVTNKS